MPFPIRTAWIIICLLAVVSFPLTAGAGEVFRKPPNSPNPSDKYLFYMHGRHVERHGAHGDYDYHGILRALASKGLIVIGEVRGDTNPRAYVKAISGQVRTLLDAGVPARNITVAGHSRGGMMTMLIASDLQNKSIKFGVLAGCGVRGSEFRRSYERFSGRRASAMRGRFLIAWDQADDVTRDCDLAMAKADVQFKNLVFKTGQGHQLFYLPAATWIEPLANFSNSS